MNPIITTSLLILLCCTLGFSSSFNVINSNDSGPGSLRQAILDSNNSPGPDCIDIDPAITSIVLTSIAFFNTNLPQLQDVILNGNNVNISSPLDSRCVDVGPGTTINDVTFDDFEYLAIYAYAFTPTDQIFLNNCNFINSSNLIDLNSTLGGAVSIVGGELHLNSCQFSNNVGVNGGAIGAFYGSGALLFLDECTFIDNIATSGDGNAIYLSDGSDLQLTGLTSLHPSPTQSIKLAPPPGDLIGSSVVLGLGFQMFPGDILDIN